jgi:hypothetical protein
MPVGSACDMCTHVATTPPFVSSAAASKRNPLMKSRGLAVALSGPFLDEGQFLKFPSLSPVVTKVTKR